MAWNVGVLTAAKQQHVQELLMAQEGAAGVSVLVLCEMGRGQHSFGGFTGYYAVADTSRSGRGAGRGQGLGVFVRDNLAGLTTCVKRTHHSVWVKLCVPGRRPVFV